MLDCVGEEVRLRMSVMLIQIALMAPVRASRKNLSYLHRRGQNKEEREQCCTGKIERRKLGESRGQPDCIGWLPSSFFRCRFLGSSSVAYRVSRSYV